MISAQHSDNEMYLTVVFLKAYFLLQKVKMVVRLYIRNNFEEKAYFFLFQAMVSIHSIV